MNMDLSKHGSTFIAFWWLKKMCKVSTLSFHSSIAGDRLLGDYILPLHLAGAVYHDLLIKHPPRAVGRCGSGD